MKIENLIRMYLLDRPDYFVKFNGLSGSFFNFQLQCLHLDELLKFFFERIIIPFPNNILK